MESERQEVVISGARSKGGFYRGEAREKGIGVSGLGFSLSISFLLIHAVKW